MSYCASVSSDLRSSTSGAQVRRRSPFQPCTRRMTSVLCRWARVQTTLAGTPSPGNWAWAAKLASANASSTARQMALEPIDTLPGRQHTIFVYAAGVDKPPRRQIDPVALAVLSVAVTVVVVVVGYLAYRMSSDPAAEVPPAAKGPTDTRLADAVSEVRSWLESKRSPAPPPAAPAPRPAVTSNCSPMPSAHPNPAPRAVAWSLGDDGRRWRYNVAVDAPASWQGATLTYQMHDSTRAPIVTARFERGEKSSTFRVGIFAAGDPSHSDMRFPGFFM